MSSFVIAILVTGGILRAQIFFKCNVQNNNKQTRIERGGMAMMMNSSGVDFVTLFSIPIYILGVFIVVFSILRFLSKASKLAWGIYLTLFLTYSLLFSSLALVTVDIARVFILFLMSHSIIIIIIIIIRDCMPKLHYQKMIIYHPNT